METRGRMGIITELKSQIWILTVRPSDHIASPQVFRSQPIFEGPEVFSEGSRVQSVLTDGFLKRLLPRHRGAPLHDFSANNNRDCKDCTFPTELNAGKINRKENANVPIIAKTEARCLLARKKKKKKRKNIMAHDSKNRGRGKYRENSYRIVGREENNERVTSLSFQCIN